MTALYVAMKLTFPHEWNISTTKFAFLINDTVPSDQLELLEERILFGLGWRVNPAAPIEYCERILGVVSEEDDDDKTPTMRRSSSRDCVGDVALIESLTRGEWLRRNRSRIDELVRLQLDAALRDPNLIRVASSCVAVAATVNALEILGEADYSQDGSHHFAGCVDRIREVSLDCELSTDAETRRVGSALVKLLLRDGQ